MQYFLTCSLLITNWLHTVNLREYIKPHPCDFREGVSPTTLAVLLLIYNYNIIISNKLMGKPKDNY